MCMYIFSENSMGSALESTKGFVLCGLWCAAIAIIQNPSNELALIENPIQKEIQIRNANLYFFSWASFICSAYILASVAQDREVVSVSAPTKLVKWYMLIVCSIVVLGISSRLKGLTCSSSFGYEEEMCRRTNYGVSFGVVSAAIAVVPITLSHMGFMKPIIEAPIAVVVLAFYCVGVGKLEFIPFIEQMMPDDFH